MPDPGSAIVYYLVFLFSVTVHEAAHAWVALIGGDTTAYHGGQVTLDPRPHIKREPMGMLWIPLISVALSGWPIGFASAPYDPDWARRHPKRAAWMALAGPGANLVLLLLAFVAIRIGAATGVFYAPDSVGFDRLASSNAGEFWTGLAFILSVVLSLNLLLLVLNLFPVPPLDGSGAVPLLLSDRATVRYQEFLWNNRGLALLGIFIAWNLFQYAFDPAFLFVLNLLYPGLGYH